MMSSSQSTATAESLVNAMRVLLITDPAAANSSLGSDRQGFEASTTEESKLLADIAELQDKFDTVEGQNEEWEKKIRGEEKRSAQLKTERKELKGELEYLEQERKRLESGTASNSDSLTGSQLTIHIDTSTCSCDH